MTFLLAIASVLMVIALMLTALARFLGRGRDFWMAVAGFTGIVAVATGLGLSGALNNFSRVPPPFVLFLLGLALMGLAVIVSPFGARVAKGLPLRTLIALQGFRVLPEILLDCAYREGLAPIQMTWHGRNLDILTAATALLLAFFWPLLQKPKSWAFGQCVLGSLLLINIVAIAVLSAPTPFRVFMNEPANTFVAQFPYIGLPAVHVLVAFILHGLTFRKLGRGAA